MKHKRKGRCIFQGCSEPRSKRTGNIVWLENRERIRMTKMIPTWVSRCRSLRSSLSFQARNDAKWQFFELLLNLSLTFFKNYYLINVTISVNYCSCSMLTTAYWMFLPVLSWDTLFMFLFVVVLPKDKGFQRLGHLLILGTCEWYFVTKTLQTFNSPDSIKSWDDSGLAEWALNGFTNVLSSNSQRRL